MSSYVCDGSADGEGCEAAATMESSTTDGGNGIGNCERSDAVTRRESTFPDGGDGISSTTVGYRGRDGQKSRGLCIIRPMIVGRRTRISYSNVVAADVVIEGLAGGGYGTEIMSKKDIRHDGK